MGCATHSKSGQGRGKLTRTPYYTVLDMQFQYRYEGGGAWKGRQIDETVAPDSRIGTSPVEAPARGGGHLIPLEASKPVFFGFKTRATSGMSMVDSILEHHQNPIRARSGSAAKHLLFTHYIIIPLVRSRALPVNMVYLFTFCVYVLFFQFRLFRVNPSLCAQHRDRELSSRVMPCPCPHSCARFKPTCLHGPDLWFVHVSSTAPVPFSKATSSDSAALPAHNPRANDGFLPMRV